VTAGIRRIEEAGARALLGKRSPPENYWPHMDRRAFKTERSQGLLTAAASKMVVAALPL
jgi:hypothetical protein